MANNVPWRLDQRWQMDGCTRHQQSRDHFVAFWPNGLVLLQHTAQGMRRWQARPI